MKFLIGVIVGAAAVLAYMDPEQAQSLIEMAKAQLHTYTAPGD